MDTTAPGARRSPFTHRSPTKGGRPQGSRPHLLVAHPSPDLYGSDRQLLETVGAMRDRGWRVTVVLPSHGPLEPELRSRGARIAVLPFPVLRKSLLSPRGLLGLTAAMASSVVDLARRLRRDRPDAVYVNTVTNPGWLVAARLARVPVLCHVHEAEQDGPVVLRWSMAAPLVLAARIVTNSAAATSALVEVLPVLEPRTVTVHNGVPGPPSPLAPYTGPAVGGPARLVLVARLSPRKGVDVALEALALLVAEGRDVTLELCGSIFPGYEWFETQLRERAARDDLAGRVTFAGYTHPTWPVLERADVVLVPSRAEPFGNTAVEGLLAGRPVVASAVQGLLEVVVDGRTGVLVEPGDPVALAGAVAGLLDAPGSAREMAAAGQQDALERFSVERYAAAVADVVDEVAGR